MSKLLDLKQLLKAGAHFGHQTHKWNPKMKPYLYGERNGISIIDLSQTVQLAKTAYEFIKKISAQNRPLLFVATKRQASTLMEEAAKACGVFYVTNRWLGGMLTNYKTISLSIDKLIKVEKMKETGDFDLLTKKERLKIEKEVEKLEKNLGGIRDMRKLPGAIFLVDPNCEKIAINEANTLQIPIVAITDSNCNPDGIDYIVPGNDDAIKSISLFIDYFASAVSEGKGEQKDHSKKEKDSFKNIDLEKEIISKYEHDIDLTRENSE